MQWLNYHHLYYFYTIACEGSVTAATQRLKLAQSTLSAQLKQFEEAIGYQLFERRHRKLKLTDVGHRVFDYAHEIFSLGEDLRETLGNLEDGLGEKIGLGVMDSIPKSLSLKLVGIACREHGARVIIAEESLSSLCSRLEKHEIDLILANDKPPTEGKSSPFYAKLVGHLPVVFVGTSCHETMKHDFPRSLSGQPMVMPGQQSPLRKDVLEYFKIKRVSPQIIAEVDDIELQKKLVLEGYGFTVLPSMAVEEEVRAKSLIRLSETPICHENLWLISTHRLVHNPIAKVLLETLRLQ